VKRGEGDLPALSEARKKDRRRSGVATLTVANQRYSRKLCPATPAESRSSDISRQLMALDSRKFVDHAGKCI